MPRRREAGVVLINVLVILALTASVVFAMLSLSDISIARSQRYSAAAQALALIAAGETSAVVALRRDMTEAPQTDHAGEAWAQTGQDRIAIAGGSFALTIEDAQARYNLNSLPGSGELGAQIVRRLTEALDLPPDVALRIAARLAQPQPLDRLEDLVTEAGLHPDDLDLLATVVTVLPGRTEVNVNTAPPALLRAITDNPVQAAALEAIRSRNGFLTPDDLTAANVILPPGVGYRSRYFWVTVTVEVDETWQRRVALLQRRTGPGEAPEVRVIARDTPPPPDPPAPDGKGT
jgi:general secretion pathway protein K